MTACPPDEYLSAVLAGTAPDAELPTFDSHLANCPHCQQRMDIHADSAQLRAWRAAAGRPPEFPFLEPSDRPGCLGRVGRFHVEREVGRGGMGVVFRAWDDALRRPVALKVLRAGRDDAGGSARFAREAMTAARVAHDHLVPVLSVEQAVDGRAVLVLPFVDGPSLRERLRAEPDFPPREAASILREVAAGLAAAHAAGLIHRDVKPANILLDRADGRAKLTDFGLARLQDHGDTLTQDGSIAGTPEYLPPEQATDARRAGPPADVYSLGATLYECLTGVVPFRGPLLEVIDRHRTEEPVPPRRLTASVPADLETITLKCLEKDPARRYPSAAELEADLARYLDGLPVLARPLGPAGRARRWVRRNPLPVAVVVVSLVGAVAAGAGWWRAGVKATEAEQNAAAASTSAAAATARAEEAEQARAETKRQAALADERAGIALSAVNTLVTRAQSLPDATPGVLALKKQLGETALAELAKLTATASKGPGTDLATAQAHLTIGDTLNTLGKTNDALAAWERGVEVAERAAAADPADLPARRQAARGHANLGFTHNRLFHRPIALGHYKKSVELLEQVRAADPDNPNVLQSLSLAYTGRGDVARDNGEPTAALADTERALELLTRAVTLDPANELARSALAYTHSRASYAYSGLLDFPTAERHFRTALANYAESRRRQPDNRATQQKFHAAQLELAGALQQLDRYDEAEALVREAVAWFDAATAATPEDGLIAQQSGIGRGMLGMLALGREQYAEADAHYAEALARYEAIAARTKNSALVAMNLLGTRSLRAGLAARLGRYAEAADDYDKLAANALTTAPGDVRMIRASALCRRLRDALRALPAAVADPATISTLPSTVAPLVAAMRATHLSWHDDLPAARREATAAREQYPAEPRVHWFAAGVFGRSAGQATDPAERERFQQQGIDALVAALTGDRGLSDAIATSPDVYPLRDHPTYLPRVRAALGVK